MGQKCSCNIMEVTNLNFGEDSEASDSSHSSSNSYTSDTDNTASDTNIATEGQHYISDCITDVSGLSNSSYDDHDIDDDDDNDTAIAGSSISIVPSTHLMTSGSSSSGMTPIPAPSPLEVIRAVTLKQNQIREQMHRRRHSLPSEMIKLHRLKKDMRFTHHGTSLRDLHAKYKGNSAPNDNSIGLAPRSQPIDINKVITNQYRIEDLYNENNSDYDPEPLHQQFRRHQQQQIINDEFKHHVLPQNNPTISMNNSTNSQNSIEDELNNIKTIANVLDTGTTFHFTMSDSSISSDEYTTDNTSASISSVSETSSDDEYVADNDDDDDDDDEYFKSRPWNKRRYKKYQDNKRKSNSDNIHSIRIIIASDDEDEKKIEEKNQINKIMSVPIKHIQLKKPKSPRTPLAAVITRNDNVQVVILSPTQTHSANDSYDFDNINFSDNDDIDDEILPLTSITPTNSFDATPKNKNIANNKKGQQKQQQFSKNLTKELLTLASDESVPSDSNHSIITSGTDQDVILSPFTPNSPNSSNTTQINNVSNLSPNSYSASDTISHSNISNISNISNSSRCSNSSLSINIKQGIAGMSIHSISNSKTNSNSNELLI